MKPNWQVCVCCNHPSNGQFAGRASAFDFSCGTHELTLVHAAREPVCKWTWEPVTRLQIGRRRFRCYNHHEWHGNWCWDATMMKRKTVRELIFHLISMGFTSEHGSELLYGWFDRMKTQYDSLEALT